jgi:DNA-binding beta-propeller fold protein YncE
MAVDSATSTVYVASDEGGSILAIDGVTRRRKMSIPFDDERTFALFSVPGQYKVFCVGETLVSVIDTRTGAVAARIAAVSECCFLGGSVSPRVGKVYVATDESLLVVDAATV